MSDNIDTKRTLGLPSADKDIASATTIFNRVTRLLESGCLELTGATNRGDFGYSLIIATRLTKLWVEGCSAYQRMRSGAVGRNTIRRASGLLTVHQKALLKELDELVADTLSDTCRSHAAELRVTVMMSLTEHEGRPLGQTKANMLSKLLRVDVKIESDRELRDWAELHFVLGNGRAIHPISVYIYDDAANEQRLLQANIVARCERYNRLLSQLTNLRGRCAALIQRGHVPIKPGSPLCLTSQSLRNLDVDIERRQHGNMPNCAVPLRSLDAESDFLEMYYKRLDNVVAQAEAIELEKLCEAETVDQALDHDFT